MHTRLYHYIKNLLLPCLVFSVVAGFFTAIIVTAFKLLAEWVIHLSTTAYTAVRENPEWLPVLILGAAAIGLLASLLLSFSHSCRGGGIPTSIAAIRGIVSFKWVAAIFLLPISALLTYLAGLPLGTEGPCVQMGTAVGDGISRCLGREKHKGWRRYVMTGGASAGFSVVTASPISAIIFAMEELHKHFSPLLLGVASMSVISAHVTAHGLAAIGIGEVEFLHIPELEALPFPLLFAPLLVGVISGGTSILFTRLYHVIDHLLHAALRRLTVKIVLPILFAITAVVGFFFAEALGSGHSIIDALSTRGALWYMIILVFLVRAIGMMVSNTSGATGGVFLPTLAFGAIIGALCADALISLGWIGEEHYLVIVVLGISAFLGATSRIPLTAAVFAVEALGGINNVLPIVIATTTSLLIIEASGLEDFTDTMIHAKMRKITKGKKPLTVDVPLTVAPGSFVVGKELRDVLWPNSCVVVSFKRVPHNDGHFGISEGDIITVHYTTYDADATTDELYALVGEQSDDVKQLMSAPV